jgi:hypothetical protein
MKFGKIIDGEKLIEFTEIIKCSNCKKVVPGGMKTGKSYYQSNEFKKELIEFKKKYLCGICRDQKRIK